MLPGTNQCEARGRAMGGDVLKRFGVFAAGALAVGLVVVFGFAGKASSFTNCPSWVNSESASECQVTGAVTADPGTSTFGKTLHVTGAGHIDASNAGGVLFDVTGDLLMDNGAVIEADDDNVGTPNTGAADIAIKVSGKADLAVNSRISAENNTQAGRGGNITLTVGGDMIMHGTAGTGSCSTTALGALISSRRDGSGDAQPQSGDIHITVGNLGVPPSGTFTEERCATVDAGSSIHSAGDIFISAGKTGQIDGNVLSESGQSGTGAPGGGMIRIDAGCVLTESDSGVISSKGIDPGADLVHLSGCDVNVKGIVQSTGAGHEPEVANHCNLDPALHPQLNDATAYAACIEIWGKNVTIDSTTLNSPDGANADGIRTPDRAWVDVFAANNISITGSQNATDPYAVHANACDSVNSPNAPCSNAFGGLLTIKANNDVNLTGRALQATALANGGNGGNVVVHAGNNVAFTNGSIDATAHTGNVTDKGGTVEVKAFNGGVTGTGSIQARGDGLANPGSTDLISCAAVTFAGTIDPAEGNVGNNTGTCGGAPSIPSTVSGYIVFHPEIWEACNRPASFSISGTKHKDTLQGAGLPGWTINLYNSRNTLISSTTTDASGQYVFNNLPAGTYKVCEVILDPSWQQVAPNPGTATCNGPNEATQGYQITLVPSKTGNDFANTQKADCKEDPNRAAQITRVVDTTGKTHGPSPVYSTVSAAYAAAANTGEVIGVYTNTNENVNLGGYKTLTITQCESAKVTATDNSTAVWWVHSTGKLTIIGPDSSGGTVGWQIDTNGNDIKAVRAYNASQVGVLIKGSSNGVSFNSVSGSPVGVQIGGNSNDVRSGTISGNGTGVVIAGASNTLSGSTVGPNTGDGVLVSCRLRFTAIPTVCSRGQSR